MANFDSVGAGLSRGLLRGGQFNLQKRQLKQTEEAAEAARIQRMVEARKAGYEDMRESSQKAFDEWMTFIPQVIGQRDPETGEIIGPDDPRAQSIIRGALTAAASEDMVNAEYLAGAQALGAPDEVTAFIPRPGEAVERRLPALQAAIDSSMIKGSAQQVATVSNYMNTETGQVIGIDKNEPGATERIRSLLATNKWVQTGLNIQDAGSLVQNKQRGDFVETMTNARNLLSETTRVREQLGDQNLRTGLVGGFVRGLDTVANQMVQAAASLGLADDGILSPAQYNLDDWGPEAQTSAAFRSNIVNLSVMMARAAEPNARLTNEDVQRQVDRLAASSGQQMGAALDEIDRAVKQDLANRHKTLTEFGEELPPIPSDLMLDAAADVPESVQMLLQKDRTQWTREELLSLSDEELLLLNKLSDKQ